MNLRILAALFAVAMTGPLAFAKSELAASVTNRLGLEIMREVTAEQKVPLNTMISPLSAQVALAMAMNGTAGQTRVQLLQRLGVDSAETLNASNKNVVRVLGRPKVSVKNERDQAPPTLLINNGAWNTNGASDDTRFTFSNEYKRAITESYGATSEALDFKNPEAAKKINDWVDKNTLGLIPKITDADTLANFAWVLINTTYLEAQWAEPFYKIENTEPNFTLAGGEKKNVQMIQRISYYAHVSNPHPEIEAAIEIPFADNGPTKLAMYAVLPAAGKDFLALQKSTLWTESSWQQIAEKLQASPVEEGRVTLPKFAFDFGIELQDKSPLTENLNLGFLFSRSADFSAMATRESQPTFVGLIKQNTRIELDELGVKAAAATMVAGVVRASPPMPRFTLAFDRPFVYAIVDRTTGTLLFVGTVADPTAN